MKAVNEKMDCQHFGTKGQELGEANLNKQNEETKQKQTHRYREQTDGCQRGGK